MNKNHSASYNQKNHSSDKIVPRLRFPEFRDAEGWKIEPLGKVYSFKSTNSFTRDDLNYESGSIKNIHYGDIHTKFSTLFDITKELVPFINPSISIDKINQECYCVEGDMIFADASEDLQDVGKSIEIVYLNGKGLLAGMHTLLARQKEPKVIVGFGGHLFMSDGIRTQIQRESQGAKVLGISGSRLSNIKIYYPKSQTEQQKIASCLSSLDEYISAESEKLEALKTHKKGLMQQLFPAEGERVPKLRFPEFKDSGEWEEKSLGEVAEIKRGAASQHLKYITDNSSGIRLLRINDFLSNSPVYVENTEDMKRFTVKTNDLLIAGTGATAGIIFMVPEKFNNLAYSYNAPRIRIYKENSFFIYEYLKSDSILQQQQKFFVGNAQPFLDTKAIANLKVNVPTLAEQQKIASCLSSLDDLITSQTEKIEALKVHKKGLMQGLFPMQQ